MAGTNHCTDDETIVTGRHRPDTTCRRRLHTVHAVTQSQWLLTLADPYTERSARFHSFADHERTNQSVSSFRYRARFNSRGHFRLNSVPNPNHATGTYMACVTIFVVSRFQEVGDLDDTSIVIFWYRDISWYRHFSQVPTLVTELNEINSELFIILCVLEKDFWSKSCLK